MTNPTPATQASSPLVRTAILVRDLARSVRFYTEVLGLTRTYIETTIRDPRAPALLGHPAGTIQHVRILKAEGPSFGMVGLFQMEPLPTNDPVPTGPARTGETCLVFYVPDLAAVVASLARLGAEVLSPPTEISVREGHSSLEMIFRDPDGVLVNCIERAPDAVWAGYEASPPHG